MHRLVKIEEYKDLNDIKGIDRIYYMKPMDLAKQMPDEHWVYVDSSFTALACGSIWYNNTPIHTDYHKIGLIGHYGSIDSDQSQQLLTHLYTRLQVHKCDIAVGPMDGTTWRRYRFTTDRGAHPRFFLELDNPDYYPQQWINAGFQPYAGYTSGITADLTRHDPRMDRVQSRMDDMGIAIHPIDMSRFSQELDKIFELSLLSFRNNLLYTPIDKSEFDMMYQMVQPYLVPELTLLAEHDNILVGFLFALPDWQINNPDKKPDTIIIKTVAVHPGRRYAGLGALLAEKCQLNAHELGYKNAIHALMYDGNESRNISDFYGETMRRYTLFAKYLNA